MSSNGLNWFGPSSFRAQSQPRREKEFISVISLPIWSDYYAAKHQQLPTIKGGTKILSEFGFGPFTQNTEFNSKLILWRGDITCLEVDAIVNAANGGLWAGGGICGAIHSAAGGDLGRACGKIGNCPTGEAVITPGFRLKAKHVIHAVGPTDGDGSLLASAYESILTLCAQHSIRSVAMCCISTGIFGFPNLDAGVIALSTTREWLEKHVEEAKGIEKIVFCTFTAEDTKIYDAITPLVFPVQLNTKKDGDANGAGHEAGEATGAGGARARGAAAASAAGGGARGGSKEDEEEDSNDEKKQIKTKKGKDRGGHDR